MVQDVVAHDIPANEPRCIHELEEPANVMLSQTPRASVQMIGTSGLSCSHNFYILHDVVLITAYPYLLHVTYGVRIDQDLPGPLVRRNEYHGRSTPYSTQYQSVSNSISTNYCGSIPGNEEALQF